LVTFESPSHTLKFPHTFYATGIGCGLCVTGCPNDAARLERKTEAVIIQPPVDFTAWEQRRLQYRGLS
jgi:ferredoxin